jgi:hypothetical protein
MSELIKMPQDLMHHLMELGQIVLVENKPVFVDECKTEEWIQKDIGKAAAEEGYDIPVEKLAAAIMRRLREQMSK